MLRYVQGEADGQEEDTDDEQPSTNSSGTHQPQPVHRLPNPDQPPSISSLGPDTQQRTTTSESTSPVTEGPSASDNVETCVTCSVFTKLIFLFCFIVLRC